MNELGLFIAGGVATMVAVISCTFWAGLPFALWQLVHRRVGRSWFNAGSLSAVATATDVQEFVNMLPDARKREDFNKVLAFLRGVLTDIRKHPTAYPRGLLELMDFTSQQLAAELRVSPSGGCGEAIKFRELAESYLRRELVKGGV
jgi:hypothetical protein